MGNNIKNILVVILVGTTNLLQGADRRRPPTLKELQVAAMCPSSVEGNEVDDGVVSRVCICGCLLAVGVRFFMVTQAVQNEKQKLD